MELAYMTRRIQMKPDAAPEPIIDPEGRSLGTFLPGFGYWITPQNEAICRKVIEDGRAIEVDENSSPFNKAGLKIGAQDGLVTGSVTIQE
jgi:hypothetical protein